MDFLNHNNDYLFFDNTIVNKKNILENFDSYFFNKTDTKCFFSFKKTITLIDFTQCNEFYLNFKLPLKLIVNNNEINLKNQYDIPLSFFKQSANTFIINSIKTFNVAIGENGNNITNLAFNIDRTFRNIFLSNNKKDSQYGLRVQKNIDGWYLDDSEKFQTCDDDDFLNHRFLSFNYNYNKNYNMKKIIQSPLSEKYEETYDENFCINLSELDSFFEQDIILPPGLKIEFNIEFEFYKSLAYIFGSPEILSNNFSGNSDIGLYFNFDENLIKFPKQNNDGFTNDIVFFENKYQEKDNSLFFKGGLVKSPITLNLDGKIGAYLVAFSDSNYSNALYEEILEVSPLNITASRIFDLPSNIEDLLINGEFYLGINFVYDYVDAPTDLTLRNIALEDCFLEWKKIFNLNLNLNFKSFIFPKDIMLNNQFYCLRSTVEERMMLNKIKTLYDTYKFFEIPLTFNNYKYSYTIINDYFLPTEVFLFINMKINNIDKIYSVDNNDFIIQNIFDNRNSSKNFSKKIWNIPFNPVNGYEFKKIIFSGFYNFIYDEINTNIFTKIDNYDMKFLTSSTNNIFNNNSQLYNASVIKIPLTPNTDVNNRQINRNNNLNIQLELDPTVIQKINSQTSIGPVDNNSCNFYLTFGFKYKTSGDLDLNLNYKQNLINV